MSEITPEEIGAPSSSNQMMIVGKAKCKDKKSKKKCLQLKDKNNGNGCKKKGTKKLCKKTCQLCDDGKSIFITKILFTFKPY